MSLEGEFQKRTEEAWSEARGPQCALSEEPAEAGVTGDCFEHGRGCRAAGRDTVGFVDFQLPDRWAHSSSPPSCVWLSLLFAMSSHKTFRIK